MFTILGAAGNIGSALVAELGRRGEQVLAVVHSAEKMDIVRAAHVEPVVVDVRDSDVLRAVFRRSSRAFLLNPPGDPTGDSQASELATARSITAALAESQPEKIVVASTYGARPGQGVGDLTTLHAFEQMALASGIPTAINRGAYYFTNFDMLIDAARAGSLPVGFPRGLFLPMVAPEDLAQAAADRLQSGVDDVGILYVEGPKRYTFGDVAEAFASALGHAVEVETTLREDLAPSYRALGFSPESAASFARMTETVLDGPELPDNPRRGTVTLEQYVGRLVSR
ncbi:MAG TPA: NAD(P)H-binding protein [Devosia sp.]|jgi:uncharacterized protein YbjT (DUF2867 family)|uniref:NAD(P)H-binding protein n=1 Tax=Devosia sp. TaxID=1871048 RepID=UPI002F949361